VLVKEKKDRASQFLVEQAKGPIVHRDIFLFLFILARILIYIH
jgi:hypothetical protein